MTSFLARVLYSTFQSVFSLYSRTCYTVTREVISFCTSGREPPKILAPLPLSRAAAAQYKHRKTITGDRRCVHRTAEGNLHQKLDDSLPTQRKQQVQRHERCTTGRYHIAQTVHSSTRKHIPTTDLGNQRLEDRDEYLSHIRFADDLLICANTP